MRRLGFQAMGTTFEAWADTASQLEAVRRIVEDVEAVCSRFRDDSELTSCNRSPEREVVVSPTLARVLGVALDLRRRTGGLVDAALGAATIAWGYDRSFENVVDRASAPRPTARDLSWTLDGNTLLRARGVVLDLGGIAKGWVCDRAVGETGARMVSAGGDMRSADPETVAVVMDPWDRQAAEIRLGCGGLATSSRTRRRWSAGGRDAHHIIDPRSLEPADTPILSATVVAASAAEAEAGAKTVLILGAEGLRWASRTSWISSALAVWADGSVYATADIELAVAT